MKTSTVRRVPAPPRTASSRVRKVGPYRVLGELGRGGMAVVYRGVHETLQRDVAIKELMSDGRDKEAFSRFRREAFALAGFRHQNIVTLYDLVEKNETPYMVMELVDGPTLSSLLADGPLPAEISALIAAKLSAALEHAHLHGITHRDIKPANVMLTRDGEVKLMDFGIAKDEDLTALTREGMAVGTPSYMSPEQVSGQPVDTRTDLYSLGALLYECVSGKKAFSGGTPAELFARIRDARCPPLQKVAPETPKPVVQTVRKAMRANPDSRYRDAAAMRRDLERFVSDRVAIAHSALLMAFLHQRGRLTETEVLSRISKRELNALDALASAPRRKQGWRLVWSFAFLTVVTVGYLQWPRVVDFLHSFFH